MKILISFVACLFFLTLTRASSAENERIYEVLSVPAVLKTFEEKEARSEVMAWFQKADPDRWAEFGWEDAGADRERYQAMAMEYFLNLKHQEGWELLCIENKTFIFKKIVFMPRVRRVPIPPEEREARIRQNPVPPAE